jgi:NAD dependent epimerase/dehydratase family enzyme
VTKVTIIRFGMVCAADGYPKKLAGLFKRGLGSIAGDGEQIARIVDIEDAVAMSAGRRNGHGWHRQLRLSSPPRITFFSAMMFARRAHWREASLFRHADPGAILDRALAPYRRSLPLQPPH